MFNLNRPGVRHSDITYDEWNSEVEEWVQARREIEEALRRPCQILRDERGIPAGQWGNV